MQDTRDVIQEFLKETIENVFANSSEEKIQNFISTNCNKSTELEIERKLSETSEISSGFEDFCSKTVSEDVETTISISENETARSGDDCFNDTIDEAIDKFEFEEKLKEASVQTSPTGVSKECQCDFVKTNKRSEKKLKIQSAAECNTFSRAGDEIAPRETLCSEKTEVCGGIFPFPKQTPRIRIGLSKRARLQPLHAKIIT